MIVQIEVDVFNTIQCYRSLDKLLILLEEEQHEWFITDDLDLIYESTWFNDLSSSHKSIFKTIAEKSFVRSIQVSKEELNDRGVIIISNSTEHNNHIDDCLKFLQEPLLIVVENATSDKLFIKRLFEIFKNPGKHLTKAAAKNFLDFYPSGGKNEMIKTLVNLSSKKDKPYMARLMVVLDSDKKYPKQEFDEEMGKLIAYCAENGYPIFFFYKREIENYIPAIVLKNRLPPELGPVFEAFVMLSETQRDFYDLERGFNNRPPLESDPLFGDLSGKKNLQYDRLRAGFHLGQTFKAKQEIYKFALDANFNAESIRQRCAHQPDPNELVNLLKLIQRKL